MARDATPQSHNSRIGQAHSRRTDTGLRQHSVGISQPELGISFVSPARLNTAQRKACCSSVTDERGSRRRNAAIGFGVHPSVAVPSA